MLRRPLDPSGRVRRCSPWRAGLVVAALVAPLVAAGCEADASPTSAPTGSDDATTVAGAPASTDDAPVTAAAVLPTLEPVAVDPTPDDTEILTGGTEVSQPAGPYAAATVRTLDFPDLTYPTSVCAPIIDKPPSGGYRLVDGVLRASADDAAGPYSVTLRPPRSFGDINGDGHEDAALVLECSRGGQPVPTGWIYTLDGSGPRPLTGVTLNPDSLPLTGVLDVSLADLRIVGTTVVTDWDIYVDGDALCCPAETAVVEWTWTDGRLTPGPPTLVDADAHG